ncbi:MAG: 4'-phosphopantetheinyl transferase superfamily protein [Myxococcota bacterium]
MSDAIGVEGRADPPSLAGLFSESVQSASAPIEDHLEALLPLEREGIAQASTARRHEFATGRWLARSLLRAKGAGEVPIPRNPDRTPGWPAGWVGSITHSGHACAVAVARSEVCRGLGIDLEPDQAVKPGLERMICFGDELAWIAAEGESGLGRRCRMVFSAKEAVYKTFHPHTRRVWRFEEVALEIDLLRERFEARLPPDAGPSTISGRILCRGGWIVSGVEWSAAESSGALRASAS